MMPISTRRAVKVVARGAGTSLAAAPFRRRMPSSSASARCADTRHRLSQSHDQGAIRRAPISAITDAVAADGFFYAPDPSSQLACTIAGNIGMNSGGAHCLKYGVTTNNVLGVKMVLVDGTVVEIGGGYLDSRGPRSFGPRRRLRRAARHCRGSDLAHPADARGCAAGALRLSDERGGGGLRRGDHRRRHRACRDRIHGQAGDRNLRGLCPCRLSARCRRAADHRGRRLARRDRRRTRARSSPSPRIMA